MSRCKNCKKRVRPGPAFWVHDVDGLVGCHGQTLATCETMAESQDGE